MKPHRYMLKHWMKRVRRHLRIRTDGLRCFYCQCTLTRAPDTDRSVTLDHLVPRSKGGKDRLSNLVLACGPCNRRKGDSTAAEYLDSPRLAARQKGVQRPSCDCGRVPGESHAWDCATR